MMSQADLAVVLLFNYPLIGRVSPLLIQTYNMRFTLN